jgi:hypothetical protein
MYSGKKFNKKKDMLVKKKADEETKEVKRLEQVILLNNYP